MSADTNYCPLCGSHPMEHGEGKPSTESALTWYDEVKKLYDELTKVRQLNG